jgi:hypothetical protein
MFAKACRKAWDFTRPVVMFMQCVDGKCRTSVGSYVVVNREGWFLSAWHLYTLMTDLNATVTNIETYHQQVEAVTNDRRLSHGDRKRALKHLKAPPGSAAVKWAPWWTNHGIRVVDIAGIPDADIMLGRLDPFDPATVPSYPSFKDPATPVVQGTSLCRLGYPFPTVTATYDSARNLFDIDVSKFQLPVFAIEGILTRQIEVSANAAGYRNAFIETSSPGLKGQSGGPVVDVNGTVWGIQSKTQHLSLGFDPPVPVEPEQAAGHRHEHQFLNVGWASHPATIAGLLREKGIAHTLTA